MAFSGQLHRDPDYASIPAKIDETLLAERVRALRNGDESVVKPIVVSLMRLVMGAVRDMRFHDDELIGVALLTLQESVLSAKDALTDDNIIPYVLTTVQKRLIDARSEKWLTLSISVRHHRRLLGTSRCHPKRSLTLEKMAESELPALELRDTLNQMVRSDRQRSVMELKAQEHTFSEIAGMLGISVSTAMREIHDLQERFNMQDS